jgi:DNA mismatch repair protein MutS
VREVGEQVLFLHRLQPGGADRSYGIEVGRLAGLPAAVIGRAREVLKLLEGEQLVPRLGGGGGGATRRGATAHPDQLGLFNVAQPHPAVERLKAIDPNSLTPLQALWELAALVEQAKRAGPEAS